MKYSQKCFSLGTKSMIPFFWVVCILLGSPFTILSQTETVKEETQEALPMHKLSNDDLLKQAEGLFQQAFNNYLSELRGLEASNFLLSKANQQTNAFRPSEKELLIPEDTPPLEVAKLETDQAKLQMEEFQQQLKVVEAEKASLDQYIETIEPAQLAARNVLTVMDDLELFLLEIRLRVADNSLNNGSIPNTLRENYLQTVRSDLFRQQRELNRKSTEATNRSKQMTERIKTTKEALIEFQALYESAEKKYAQELSGQSIVQEYQQKSSSQLLFELAELDEELVLLDGTFDRSFRSFSSTEKEVAELQAAIEQMEAPEATDLFQKQLVRAEEVEQAAKEVEGIVNYHTERINQFWSLRSKLNSLIRQSEAFQGDGTVLSSHFFRMQAIATILEDSAKQGKIQLDQIPSYNRTEALAKEREEAATKVTQALSIAQKAEEQLANIAKEVQKSESTRTDIRERLQQMRKTSEAARQAQEWNAGLKDLSAQQIVERFNENSEKMTNNQQELETAKAAFKEGQTAVDEAQKKFESLKDPLLLSAQDESEAEKQTIAKKLYELAELEVPKEQKEAAKTPDAMGGNASAEPSEETKVAPEKPEEKAEREKKQYQNLIATRIRIIDEREKGRIELLDALKSLNEKLDAYVTVLNEANKLALQHYANSVELKKRAGQRELKSHEIPYNISEGLKRDRITELEEEIASLTTQQVQLTQQIKTLEVKDESLQEIQTLSSETLKLVGNRLDILEDLKKLEQDLEVDQKALSDSDLKTLEQAALRRLKSEESLEEYLVSFVPAEGTENLTALLQNHFMELTELERKQRNLGSQSEEIERLIKLAEEEKTSIDKLLPIFNTQLEQLNLREEEEWAKIRIRFAPEKAEEILAKFEEKAGRRFPIPAAIAEDDKAASIEAAVPNLYEQHVQLVAARNWINLFERRLSPEPSGLIVEIGQYQEKLGELNARNSSLQRRVNFLTGHPVEEIPELEPGEKPMTASERRQFLEGEIAMLRAERLETRTQTGIIVAAKLVSIIVITFLLLTLVNFVSHRTIRREEEKEDGSAQNVLVYSLVKGITKLVIWIFAIIISLHYTGFNVGAILAGLGIFGFAIAMASKELISNLIGGINILVAKPFQVGDYVVFDGTWVLVDKIGLQYTHLRTFATKFLLVVPNSKLSEGTLVNANNPDYRGYRHVIELPLSRRNSVDKLELAVKILEDIVNNYEHTKLNWARINKIDHQAILLKLRMDMADVDYYARDAKYINTTILREFEANGIEFAARAQFNLYPPQQNVATPDK